MHLNIDIAMENTSELKEQYYQLVEYLSTITWMHYEEAKKRGRDSKGYLFFFGRTLHRLIHPLYFYHQKEVPDFRHAFQNFDPNNPEEKFGCWAEKKLFLATKFHEKKLEIYSPEFTRKLISKYNHQVFQWLVKNHLSKVLEFDPNLGFYCDILNWSEDHFLAFLEGPQGLQSDYLQLNSSSFPSTVASLA